MSEETTQRAVFVPFHASNFVIAGSNSSVYGTQMAHAEASGEAIRINLAASATLANPWCGLTQFNGDIFGLVYEIYAGAGVPGVWIDGVAYEVPAYPPTNPFGRVNNTKPKPRLSGEIIATGLGPGPHWLELVFPNHVTETRQWNLYGLLLDSRAGYQPQAKVGTIAIQPAAVGTSYTTLAADTTTLQAARGLGIRQIYFYNTTASPITVTLSRTATSAGHFHAITVPANGSPPPFDPGIVLANHSYLYAIASGAGVNYAVVEAL